jgi:hypothetical protein
MNQSTKRKIDDNDDDDESADGKRVVMTIGQRRKMKEKYAKQRKLHEERWNRECTERFEYANKQAREANAARELFRIPKVTYQSSVVEAIAAREIAEMHERMERREKERIEKGLPKLIQGVNTKRLVTLPSGELHEFNQQMYGMKYDYASHGRPICDFFYPSDYDQFRFIATAIDSLELQEKVRVGIRDLVDSAIQEYGWKHYYEWRKGGVIVQKEQKVLNTTKHADSLGEVDIFGPDTDK